MNHGVTNLKIFLASLPSLKNNRALMSLAFAGLITFSACSKKPPVIKPDPIVETVPNPEDFVKEPVGVITIETTGEKVDLAKLKAQYGDLYRLVEPMTDKEIDDQYKAAITVWRQSELITAENFKKYGDKGEVVNIYGYLMPATQESLDKYGDATNPLYRSAIKQAGTSKDSVISSKYSFYFRPIGNGVYDFIYTNEMLESIKTGELGNITKGDKEVFVRYYKIGMDIERQVRKVQGLSLVNQFKNSIPIIEESETVSKTK